MKQGEIISCTFLFLVVVKGDHSAQPSYGGSGTGNGGARSGFGGRGGGGFVSGAGSKFGGGDSAGFERDFGSDSLSGLAEAIPGEAGLDYPILAEVPETSFSCSGQVEGGFYADPEAECQAFHICGGGGGGQLSKYSFLCPNGTIFSQQYFICDWWFNVDCSQAESLYSLNEELAAERAANSPGLGSYGGGEGGAGGQAGGRRGGVGGRGGSRKGSGKPGLSE